MNNSAVKTIKILEYIAGLKSPAGVSEIGRELGYAKSTVFDILAALLECGYIQYANEQSKTFCIGLKAYQIGMSYINATSLYKVAHPVLESIEQQIGEMVYLAVESDGYIVYLDRVECNFPIRSICNIGSKNLMHVTGLGKAILAAHTNDEIISLTKGKFERRTADTIMNIDNLLAETEKIRKRGYAEDAGEDIEMIRCIAAPVRDCSNQVVGAISASMLAVNFEQKKDKAVEIIVSNALKISQGLGYMGTKLYF